MLSHANALTQHSQRNHSRDLSTPPQSPAPHPDAQKPRTPGAPAARDPSSSVEMTASHGEARNDGFRRTSSTGLAGHLGHTLLDFFLGQDLGLGGDVPIVAAHVSYCTGALAVELVFGLLQRGSAGFQ